MTSTKVTDKLAREFVNQSSASLNRVKESPSSEVFPEFKKNYSSDSLDRPLVLSKKFIIIPSQSTTSIDKRQSQNLSQPRKHVTRNESNISLNGSSFESPQPDSDFKHHPHHQSFLKSDRFSSNSMKSTVSGIYSCSLNLIEIDKNHFFVRFAVEFLKI